MYKMSLKHCKTTLRTKIVSLVALMACVCALFSAYAFAASANIVAYTYEGGVRTYYTSIQEAIQVGYDKGYTIYMARDWEIDSAIEIADSKTLTIDMNGHALRHTKATGSEMILLNEHASLTLKSTTKSTFTYTGYDSATGSKQSYTIQTGGLVTGGETNYAGCMRVLADAKLTLDNVAIAGNEGNYVGGLEAKGNAIINMRNGASIEHNYGVLSKSGYGAIFANGDDITINMDNSKIANNRANSSKGGGGIYSYGSATRIFLKNNSSISENYADNGGGVYFAYSYFGIYGDNTCSISGNHVTGLGDEGGRGGGVFTEHCALHSCEGTLQGINITNNCSRFNGGGAFLDQKWTRVIDCTIKGNQCSENGKGGGIYVDADNISLEGCTITDNFCNGSKEGGGAFINSLNDVKLTGVTVIENNTRGQGGSADDLFLQDSPFTNAYITGGVDAGSKVGIRTSSAGERRIGKSISTYTAGTYFCDLDGYYVTHGTDSDGDLWQRANATDFQVALNGQNVARYKPGDLVTLDGSSTDSSKTFWYWDAENTIGLQPISSYITSSNKYSSTFTFKMPQNDVDVKAVYVDKVTNITLSLAQFGGGKALPTTATLSWGVDKSKTVAITWKDEYGNAVTSADYNSKYYFKVTASDDQELGLCFSQDITPSNVTLLVDGRELSADTSSVSVRSGQFVATGYLQTAKATLESIEDAKVTVTAGTTLEELKKLLPSYARINLTDGNAVSLAVQKTSYDWPAGMVSSNTAAYPGEYSMYLGLSSTDQFDTADAKLKVIITVKPASTVAEPVLSPISGTYDKRSGEVKLDGDLNLKVTAASSTTYATIKYQVKGADDKWSAAQVYDSTTGIVLAGKENSQVTYTVRAWAEYTTADSATGKESTISSGYTEATYTLDDTLSKSIDVSCTDTAQYSEGETPWSASFAVAADLGQNVTITAPEQTGRIFSHWEWGGAPKGTDLAQETLTISDFKTEYSGKIKAVYIPVITAIDLGFDAPAAHDALAGSVSSVKVNAGGNATTTDIASCFADGAKLSWAPVAQSDGTAAHDTSYSAYLQWKTNSGVEYALASDATLTLNGQSVEGVAVCESATESGRNLCVTFPATGSLSAGKVAAVSVSMTHEEACVCLADDADEDRTASWGLPDEVQVTYACGETGLADVTWEKVKGFDADVAAAQTLTVTGTVNYSSGVDATAAPKTVTAIIGIAAAGKVAAPTANIEPGTYGEAQRVEFECATPGSTIRYTIDGSEPDENSKAYNGTPIAVSDTVTLKARAFHDGMGASDVVEFAYSIEHTVTFDSAGGSAVASQQVVGGSCVSAPDVPMLEGFTFQYWADENGNEYKFDTQVHSDITLYARWTSNGDSTTAHVVTFNTAGGSAVASQTVANGRTATEPEAPTHEGFKFQSWCLEDGTPYDFSTQVTSDLKLYASWSMADDPVVPCTVTFASNGGSPIAEQVVASGFTADEPANPVRKGYKFKGWCTEDGAEYDFSTPVTGDITLTARWRKNYSPTPSPTPSVEYAKAVDVPLPELSAGDELPATATAVLTRADGKTTVEVEAELVWLKDGNAVEDGARAEAGGYEVVAIIASSSDPVIKYNSDTAVTFNGRAAEDGTRVDEAGNVHASFKVSAVGDISQAAVTLAKAKLAYSGKRQSPEVASVTLPDGTELVAGEDYELRASSGKRVGSYVLVLIGIGDYTGAVAATYKIVPAKVKGLEAKRAGKKAVKLSWKKAKAQRSGVQVRYSAKKSMKGAKRALAKGASAKAKTLKKLKSGKRCYFQARAYKVVNGVKYYSSWGKKVRVKVK